MIGFVIVQYRADGRLYLQQYDIGGGMNFADWEWDKEEAQVFRDREDAKRVASHFVACKVLPV